MNRPLKFRRTFAMLAAAATFGLLAPLAVATPTHAQAQGAACPQTYTVQRGDTLLRIARAHNMTLADIQQLNNIVNPNRIFAGQRLCVASQSVGQTQYIVQAGDRLGQIARRFGVDLSVLARVNNITNVNRIYVGQVLLIPDFTIQA